jgi:hypothetical protein
MSSGRQVAFVKELVARFPNLSPLLAEHIGWGDSRPVGPHAHETAGRNGLACCRNPGSPSVLGDMRDCLGD